MNLRVTFSGKVKDLEIRSRSEASDIEITAREIQKLKKELYTIIADHSHTSFDKVWADSDRDYWMTAQEAKEYGMIDQVYTKK